MSQGLEVGAALPDFELADDEGKRRRLSELQGEDLMVLQLGRGEHCPRERQQHRELVHFHQWCAVAFTQLVTILPNNAHETNKLKITTGAYWTFLCDEQLEVQAALQIKEYTDTHHPATVPHTLVVGPNLTIGKVYVGYWFWGRPSIHQLWADLQELTRRIKDDYDPTIPLDPGAMGERPEALTVTAALAAGSWAIVVADVWLVLSCWKHRTVLGGVGGLVGVPLVVFAFLSGLTGGTARASLAIALMFLVLGACLYRLGHALERLLDREPEHET